MRTQWTWMAALTACVAASGCTAARMAVPHGLGGQDAALAVQRHTGLFEEGSLRFGAHRVTGYASGWSSTPSLSFGSGPLRVTTEWESHPFHFRAEPAEATAREVQCEVTEQRVGLTHEGQVAGRPASSTLEATVQPRRMRCAVTPSGGKGRGGWVEVERTAGPSLSNPYGRVAGHARLDGVELQVESATQLEGGARLAFAGFELRDGDRVVGAVETLNDGRVWLAPDVSPEVREVAVVAASALLLDPTWQAPVD